MSEDGLFGAIFISCVVVFVIGLAAGEFIVYLGLNERINNFGEIMCDNNNLSYDSYITKDKPTRTIQIICKSKEDNSSIIDGIVVRK